MDFQCREFDRHIGFHRFILYSVVISCVLFFSLQALKDEGHNPDEYLFEIATGKGKAGKPVTPSKASKELESSRDENPADDGEKDEDNNGHSMEEIDEDELVIKDDIDSECFEEVDQVGDVSGHPTQNSLNDEIKADDNIEIGHNDNDDSLNLTIGEEEEHFLNEENDKKGTYNL